jgi:hypothetical protein
MKRSTFTDEQILAIVKEGEVRRHGSLQAFTVLSDLMSPLGAISQGRMRLTRQERALTPN